MSWPGRRPDLAAAAIKGVSQEQALEENLAGDHPGYVQIGETLSWTEFQTHLYDCLDDERRSARYGDWIFRGQRQSSWGLQAALRRSPYIERPSDFEYLNTIISKVLEGFRADLLNQGFNPTFVGDEMALLGLAQHYGVPTNFLDWSYSPYVAAHFAFQEVNAGDGSVAIWALNTQDAIMVPATNEVLSSPSDRRPKRDDRGQPKLLLVHPQPYGNIRLRNQAGVFTLLRSSERTVEEFLANNRFERTDWPLLKFVISSAEAARIRRDLGLMMISDGQLFPGVESAAARALDALRSRNLDS
jgi:hypothetical protein